MPGSRIIRLKGEAIDSLRSLDNSLIANKFDRVLLLFFYFVVDRFFQRAENGECIIDSLSVKWISLGTGVRVSDAYIFARMLIYRSVSLIFLLSKWIILGGEVRPI